jgi:hypothetical protein
VHQAQSGVPLSSRFFLAIRGVFVEAARHPRHKSLDLIEWCHHTLSLGLDNSAPIHGTKDVILHEILYQLFSYPANESQVSNEVNIEPNLCIPLSTSNIKKR